MIVLPVEQGAPEWVAARLGLPTASRFSDILTAKTLKYSASASGYRNELLSEWCTGFPFTRAGSTGAMDRGTGMEGEARTWLEMHRDYEVHRCGFVLRDDHRVGGSPDGLVGSDGLAELKCPMIHTHIGYLIDGASLEDKYRAQVQGYLHLTGRQWADVVSYHPTLPKVLVRVDRDEAFQEALDVALKRFLSELDEGRERLVSLGVIPKPTFIRAADPQAWTEAA